MNKYDYQCLDYLYWSTGDSEVGLRNGCKHEEFEDYEDDF